MAQPFPWRMLAIFGAKFCAAMVVLAPLWWLCLPGYGWLLVQGCGALLKNFAGMPVTAAHVQVQGILNTESQLVFYIGDRERLMKFALLVTNLPPFIALVMATSTLSFRRKITITLAGTALLVAVHAIYIMIALRFGALLAANGEISTAMSQFFLTLPFLLWIVMAYWNKAVDFRF